MESSCLVVCLVDGMWDCSGSVYHHSPESPIHVGGGGVFSGGLDAPLRPEGRRQKERKTERESDTCRSKPTLKP